jgi:hypothetical protein
MVILSSYQRVHSIHALTPLYIFNYKLYTIIIFSFVSINDKKYFYNEACTVYFNQKVQELRKQD